MQIKIKLMGALQSKTPEGGLLEVDAGTTVADILSKLEIKNEMIQTIMHNGSMLRDRETGLADGDDLMVLAPVGGG